MARNFAYVRVSTAGQTVENQTAEIASAGYAIERRRIIAETVSASSAIEQGPGFPKLMDRLEPGDVLVVTKMDRRGRKAIDVAQTVERLAAMEVRVLASQCPQMFAQFVDGAPD